MRRGKRPGRVAERGYRLTQKLAALWRAYGWTIEETKQLTVAEVEAAYGELRRVYAIEDLRHLDLIVAPHAEAPYYQEVRSRLAYVSQHGMTEEEHIKVMTPEELKVHNRRQFARMRAIMNSATPTLYGPDGQPASASNG